MKTMDMRKFREENIAQVFFRNEIKFHSPSKGHYKILSYKEGSMIYYPKSGTLVWYNDNEGRQTFKAITLTETIEKILEII